MTDDDDGVTVVIVQRGSRADARQDPAVTGLTLCRCGYTVLLRGEATTKVAAQTCRPLCVECVADITREHPEAFSPDHRIGTSE
jgi:hypothetical protein